VSPTDLILLTGGVLLLSSPLRAALASGPRVLPRSAVQSVAAVAALTAFFHSYVSVFTEPGSVTPLTTIPEGAPGHQTAELPAVARLGGYPVTTLLLVVPVIYLRRTGRSLRAASSRRSQRCQFRLRCSGSWRTSFRWSAL
jgi:hypothetical protein